MFITSLSADNSLLFFFFFCLNFYRSGTNLRIKVSKQIVKFVLYSLHLIAEIIIDGSATADGLTREGIYLVEFGPRFFDIFPSEGLVYGVLSFFLIFVFL